MYIHICKIGGGNTGGGISEGVIQEGVLPQQIISEGGSLSQGLHVRIIYIDVYIYIYIYINISGLTLRIGLYKIVFYF